MMGLFFPARQTIAISARPVRKVDVSIGISAEPFIVALTSLGMDVEERLNNGSSVSIIQQFFEEGKDESSRSE